MKKFKVVERYIMQDIKIVEVDEKELDCIFKFLEKSINNIKPIDK